MILEAELSRAGTPTIQTMLTRGTWNDVGAIAKIWGGVNEEPTCRTAAANESTRRDYAFANDRFLPLITKFEVEKGDVFATHSPIALSVNVGNMVTTKRTFRKPKSAKAALEEKVEKKKEDNAKLQES